MAPKKVVSKQFSCSELKSGHADLMRVKKESISQEELQKQIKESCALVHQMLAFKFCFRPMGWDCGQF